MGLRSGEGQGGKPRFGRSLTLPAPRFPASICACKLVLSPWGRVPTPKIYVRRQIITPAQSFAYGRILKL
jgi:hypothetical protein